MVALIQKGGVFMIPLLLCSFYALFIALEFALFFWRVRRSKARTGVAEEIALKVPDCQLSHFIKESLPDKRAIEQAGSRAIDWLAQQIERLEFLASVSTLLGLTGTVSGIIKTFLKVQEKGSHVNIALLAGGIWEALLTTLFGLCIAIFSLTAYFFLSQELERVAHLLEEDLNIASRTKKDDTD